MSSCMACKYAHIFLPLMSFSFSQYMVGCFLDSRRLGCNWQLTHRPEGFEPNSSKLETKPFFPGCSFCSLVTSIQSLCKQVNFGPQLYRVPRRIVVFVEAGANEAYQLIHPTY